MMRPNPWILIMTILLSVAWSLERGTNENPSVNPTKTPQPSKYYANKSKVFNNGSNVNLTCSDKTWNEVLHVIWNIYFRDHSCKITFSSSGEAGENSCRDGMSLRNTSSAQSYLYIPNFSTDDVGMYECESVYRGGRENYNINVSITVAPKISAWLEYDGSKTVAVCRAEQGNPAANISWSPAENKSVMSMNPSDGFFNVESRLSEEEFPENLTCIISHQLWNQDKTLVPDRSKMKAAAKAHLALTCTGAVGVALVILGGLVYFALKKPTLLPFCQQTDTSTSKPPMTSEDVEEVEPYASYVQRVNSIYN
ncbi:cell surface glycoprotein CD200 receptor 1-B isoform X1 [Oryzias latipes]|uniref:Ig-like domain-containing protein n=1 Tax=Oryzias latipes TaxID=8090 RepID=A0A3B3I157_ORYLA|nr:cell surface glycoprotein CD200 receptor 1-B isoform X1 [Oryzias latipes]